MYTTELNPAGRELLTSSTTDTVTAMIDTTLQAIADHATTPPIRAQLTIDSRPAWTIVIDLTHSTQAEAAAAAIADEGRTDASTFYWCEHHAAHWEP